MKKIMIGLLLSLSMVGYAQTGEKNFIDQNYIEVIGKAELEVSPDMIYLKIVLSDKNNKDKLTLPEIEKKMIDKLTEIGIDVNKDLSLLDFASNLRSYSLKLNNVMLTKQYQLIVHDAKALQKVFFEFQKLDIPNVSIVKLEHSKMEQYRKDAKVLAVKAAKEKAELLSAALNQKIGKALLVQEAEAVDLKSYSDGQGWLTGKVAGVASNVKIRNSGLSNESMDADIEFEKIKIESVFLVRFSLE